MNKNNINGRSVLMVRFGASEEEYRYEFFGSAASLYDKYTSAEIGISQGALNNYFYKNKNMDGTCKAYRNAKCLIIKSTIYTKMDNRGRKELTLF